MRTGILLTGLLLATSTASGQIRINEISIQGAPFGGSTQWVELFNEGSTTVNVSTYWLCNFPVYMQVSTLTALSGNAASVPAGGYLVLAYTLATPDAEVGLYRSSSFSSSTAIDDYVTYGKAGHTRETVAVSAGVWTAGAFVVIPASGQTLSFLGTDNNNATDWGATTPTPGTVNASATATEDTDLPAAFTLLGNYPNPFNPATRISLALPEAAVVTVTVFDLQGRAVLERPAEALPAGVHRLRVDASALPSGTYLYRVTADGRAGAQVRSGVMTLLK